MNDVETIVGAGLTGLIAAYAWPRARVVERAARPPVPHAALLRFRSDAVARLTGIEFRPVEVRKGIVFDGRDVGPSIALANRYAAKCLGVPAADRSIWNLEPVKRWIAPEDFRDQLLRGVESRVEWNVDWRPRLELRPDSRPTTVFTGPLPWLLRELLIEEPATLWGSPAPIVVVRARLRRGIDLYQTIYFPGSEVAVYRASVTGSLLIVEAMETDRAMGMTAAQLVDEVLPAFGLDSGDLDFEETLDLVPQAFGKIIPLPDVERKRVLWKVTHSSGVYLLGRFATWRNILLDDVVNDIAVIKRLLRSDSIPYDLRKVMTR